LSGGQGTGKSTFSEILKIILSSIYKLNIVSFSLDDFYKTLNERKKLSKLIHPLLKTRGAPGTHDDIVLLKIIKKLKNKKFKKVTIPKFDKSKDDRFKRNFWQKITKKPDIIIFEGWCVGAKPQNKKDLKRPINQLEKKEDIKLTWRKKINNELNTNYKKIFKLVDYKIFIKAPSFNHVFKWRLLQEKKLGMKSKNKNIMKTNQVKRFIMFYERITKNMIKNFKDNDIIINLNTNHKIKSLIIND
jgi:Predicted kinase